MAKNMNKPLAATLDHVNSAFIQITVRGTVKRKNLMGNSLQFTVQTINRNAPKAAIDYPRFFIYEDINRYDKLFSVDDRVTVIASMRTSKKYRNGYFVVQDIIPESSSLDMAFSDKDFMTNINQNLDMNQWKAEGIVSRPPYTPNSDPGKPDVTILSVRVDDGGYPSYLRVVCFGKAATAARRKKEGDTIRCVGYIETKYIENDSGERVNSESLICTDLS